MRLESFLPDSKTVIITVITFKVLLILNFIFGENCMSCIPKVVKTYRKKLVTFSQNFSLEKNQPFVFLIQSPASNKISESLSFKSSLPVVNQVPLPKVDRLEQLLHIPLEMAGLAKQFYMCFK